MKQKNKNCNTGKRKELTQERLKELLYYNPKTGNFINKIQRAQRIKKGSIAGGVNVHGYIRIMLDNVSHIAHRLAFLYMEGYWPENVVDHIDRNPANNIWENLRHVSQQCNMMNRNVFKNNTSGVTGVRWSSRHKKWHARIKANNKNKGLGRYKFLHDAVKARWEAEVKYNFPSCNTTSSAYLYLKNNNLLENK